MVKEKSNSPSVSTMMIGIASLYGIQALLLEKGIITREELLEATAKRAHLRVEDLMKMLEEMEVE